MKTLVLVSLGAGVCGLSSIAMSLRPAGYSVVEQLSDIDCSHQDAIHGAGYFEPISEVRELAFEHSGFIEEVPVMIGAVVEAGEALARLRDTELVAQLSIARAELAVAEAELDFKVEGEHPERIAAQSALLQRLEAKQRLDEIQFNRVDDLYSDRNAATQEYEEARLQLAQTDSAVTEAESQLRYLHTPVTSGDMKRTTTRVEQARAAVRLATAKLEKSTLRAPFRGTVLGIYRREGESAGTLETVLAFADVSKFHVRAEIDERFAADVRLGQLADIRLRARDRSQFRGRVLHMEPLMGRKRLFSRSSDERTDLDVIEVIIALDTTPDNPIVNERVDVEILRS